MFFIKKMCYQVDHDFSLWDKEETTRFMAKKSIVDSSRLMN
ncbi:hypothetical protein DOT_1575 [Desulfosporosinus sp. OT]|nr:hypothetical protein DOT_1575 [Desulfosporosinus sp. OT]